MRSREEVGGGPILGHDNQRRGSEFYRHDGASAGSTGYGAILVEAVGD